MQCGAVGGVSPGVCWALFLVCLSTLGPSKAVPKFQRWGFGLKHVSGFLYYFISDCQRWCWVSKMVINVFSFVTKWRNCGVWWQPCGADPPKPSQAPEPRGCSCRMHFCSFFTEMVLELVKPVLIDWWELEYGIQFSPSCSPAHNFPSIS